MDELCAMEDFRMCEVIALQGKLLMEGLPVPQEDVSEFSTWKQIYVITTDYEVV